MRWIPVSLAAVVMAACAWPVFAQTPAQVCEGLTGAERRACLREQRVGAVEQSPAESPQAEPAPTQQTRPPRMRPEGEGAAGRRNDRNDPPPPRDEAAAESRAENLRRQEAERQRRRREIEQQQAAAQARQRATAPDGARSPERSLPAVWSRPAGEFINFDQLAASDGRLYVSSDWALGTEVEERSPRIYWTCLATVYAVIEQARGNSSYRIGPDTYRDTGGGAVPIAGVGAGSDIRVTPMTLDTLRAEFSRGNPVILRGFSPSLRQGHYVLAIGIGPSGRVVAVDPYGGRRIEIEPSTWRAEGSRAGELQIQQYRLVNFAARSSPPTQSRPTTQPPSRPPAPPAPPARPPTPPAPATRVLVVNGFEQSIPATTAPYTHRFGVTGSALDAVDEIRWSWRGPNSGSSVWRRGDQNWSRYAPSSDGRSATVRPVVVAAGDPAGVYRWTVTFSVGGQQVSRSFDIHYAPDAPPPPQPPPPAPRPAVTAPPVPGNPSPGSGTGPGSSASGATVQLEWRTATGAVEYDLGVRDMTTNQLVVDRRVGDTSFRARLEPGRAYRWNVRACNAAGCSAFTAPLYFRTPGGEPPPPSQPRASVPAMPDDPSPGSASGPGPIERNLTVRLNWDNVDGADEYDLGIRDMTTNRLVEDRRVGSSSFSARLEPGREYRWNVRACNSAGCSAFTRPLYFRTPSR